MEDFVGHEDLSRRDSRRDAQALELGENVSDSVTDPGVGQLTCMSVPHFFLFLFCIKLLTTDHEERSLIEGA